MAPFETIEPREREAAEALMALSSTSHSHTGNSEEGVRQSTSSSSTSTPPDMEAALNLLSLRRGSVDTADDTDTSTSDYQENVMPSGSHLNNRRHNSQPPIPVEGIEMKNAFLDFIRRRGISDNRRHHGQPSNPNESRKNAFLDFMKRRGYPVGQQSQEPEYITDPEQIQFHLNEITRLHNTAREMLKEIGVPPDCMKEILQAVYDKRQKDRILREVRNEKRERRALQRSHQIVQETPTEPRNTYARRETSTSTSTSTMSSNENVNRVAVRQIGGWRAGDENVTIELSSDEDDEPVPVPVCASTPDLIPIGEGYAKIPMKVFRTLDWTSHTTATRKLLTAVFPRSRPTNTSAGRSRRVALPNECMSVRERYPPPAARPPRTIALSRLVFVLATSSLTGKASPAFPNKPAKKQLDPKIVDDIVQVVSERCKVPENIVRTSITTKCADESKMLRNRQVKRVKRPRSSTEESDN